MGSGIDLLDLFRSEAVGHVAALEEGLAAAAGGLGAEAAEPLARAAHSMKGAARIVDILPAARLAEAMEERLDACRTGRVRLGPAEVAVLRRAAEVMREIAEIAGAELAAWTMVHGDDLEALIAEVRGGPPQAGHTAEARPAPPPPTPVVRQASHAPPPPPRAPVATGPRTDPALIDLFRLETETYVAELSQGLLALERDPGHPERVQQLMRAAHSIKGAARVVEIDLAVELAHMMEDCFVAAGEGRIDIGPDQIDLLLRGSDMLLQLARAGAELPAWIEENGGATTEITGRIATILNQRRPTGPTPAPAQAAIIEHPTEADDYPELPTLALPQRGRDAAAGAARPAADDRAVRVTVGNINRLMNLAGESLVAARDLDRFVGGARKLGQRQAAVADLLADLADELHGVLGEDAATLLAEARSRALEVRRATAEHMAEMEGYARRSEDLTSRMYQAAVASRMRPFGDHLQGFPRLVRDLARRLDKKVELTIIGENVGVDREILEKLEAPLNHLIRNAVDHGIEAPAVRLAAGKPERGRLRLEARHWAGMLSVSVSDDGGGIDPARVRARIAERGLAAPEVAAGLPDVEALDYLFMPGFSTADRVTEISGRGVGLDVVRSAVQEVGGSVRLQSEVGHGTTFHLQLPITLSVIRAVIVAIDGEPYAFPLTRIERIVAVPRAEVRSLESHQYFVLEGKNVGLVPATRVLELGVGGDRLLGPDPLPVVVLADRAQLCGVAVDRFLGEHDLVIRPLDHRLGKVADIAAAAVMTDGSPVLIVDVEDMVRSIVRLLQGGQLRGGPRRKESAQRSKKVLVVDDSITVREVERQLLANRGYTVTVAVDGMDGWLTLRQGEFDLVITDVDMPRMNGIELVRSIKQDQRLRDTPVMIVSYKDREEDKRRGLEAGANYYLTKSNFHDDTLLDAVVDLIGEPET